MTRFGKNSPIGFFDSGVGGLSVYSRFKKVLPNENTLYFGDLAHLPYGNKTQEKAKRRKMFSIRINSSRISIVLFGKQIVEIG